MTKMTAMPIYCKTLDIKHWRPEPIIFCSNDNPGLKTCFTVRSYFATKVFVWEDATIMDSLEIISSCDLEFGLYSKLNG